MLASGLPSRFDCRIDREWCNRPNWLISARANAAFFPLQIKGLDRLCEKEHMNGSGLQEGVRQVSIEGRPPAQRHGPDHVKGSPIVWIVFNCPKLGINELHEPTMPVSAIRSAKMCAKTNRSRGRGEGEALTRARVRPPLEPSTPIRI